MIAGVGHTNMGHSLDALSALENWVEKAVAPGTLIDSQLTADNQTVLRTRPICRYPAWAKYPGSGDVNSAASFVCATS